MIGIRPSDMVSTLKLFLLKAFFQLKLNFLLEYFYFNSDIKLKLKRKN